PAYTSFTYCFCHRPPAHSYFHSFPTRRSSDLRLWYLTVKTREKKDMLRSKVLDLVRFRQGLMFVQSVLIHCAVSLFFHFFPFRRSEEHTSELQSRENLVCRLLFGNKKIIQTLH